jgi:hypothetical protein
MNFIKLIPSNIRAQRLYWRWLFGSFDHITPPIPTRLNPGKDGVVHDWINKRYDGDVLRGWRILRAMRLRALQARRDGVTSDQAVLVLTEELYKAIKNL